MTMTAEHPTKTNTVEESIDVDVPISEVYNQWTQFESFPQFMEGVESITQLDDKNLHWKAKVGNQVREWDARITEQLPDERIAWTSIDGKYNAGVVTFHRISDTTTRIMLQMDWETEGFVEKVGAALNFDDRQVKNDLDRFKDLIESHGFAEGAWRGQIDRPGT